MVVVIWFLGLKPDCPTNLDPNGPAVQGNTLDPYTDF